MTRVLLANDVAQIDVPSGRRYGGNRPGQVFDMSPGDAAAVVKIGGVLASVAGTTRRSIGFRCGCGFAPVVRRCSRCGGQAERE